jgi:hypothetical protein
VSVDSSGAQGNGDAFTARISGDGLTVAFISAASNFFANDTNGRFDVFVRGGCPTLASWANYGSGYPGTNGVPGFTSRQNPVLGTTITLDLSNSAASATAGLVVVGFNHESKRSSWGGRLLVEPWRVLPVALPAGGATLVGTIPNDPTLCAIALDLQAVELDAGASHGVSFTAGLNLLLGN